jgi:hypothetical protein
VMPTHAEGQLTAVVDIVPEDVKDNLLARAHALPDHCLTCAWPHALLGEAHQVFADDTVVGEAIGGTGKASSSSASGSWNWPVGYGSIAARFPGSQTSPQHALGSIGLRKPRIVLLARPS